MVRIRRAIGSSLQHIHLACASYVALVLHMTCMAQNLENACPGSVQMFLAKWYRKPLGIIPSDIKVLNEKGEIEHDE